MAKVLICSEKYEEIFTEILQIGICTYALVQSLIADEKFGICTYVHLKISKCVWLNLSLQLGFIILHFGPIVKDMINYANSTNVYKDWADIWSVLAVYDRKRTPKSITLWKHTLLSVKNRQKENTWSEEKREYKRSKLDGVRYSALQRNKRSMIILVIQSRRRPFSRRQDFQ